MHPSRRRISHTLQTYSTTPNATGRCGNAGFPPTTATDLDQDSHSSVVDFNPYILEARRLVEAVFTLRCESSNPKSEVIACQDDLAIPPRNNTYSTVEYLCKSTTYVRNYVMSYVIKDADFHGASTRQLAAKRSISETSDIT